jgi:hypothetical protein
VYKTKLKTKSKNNGVNVQQRTIFPQKMNG